MNILSSPPTAELTAFEQVDHQLERLTSRKHAWVAVSRCDRIQYLERCIEGVMAVADDWADAACRAKGIDPHSSLAGEEWIAGPVATLLNLRLLIRSLQAGGQPPPVRLSQRPDGQAVAQVFPDNAMDRLLWWGYRGEVWIEPGQPATQGNIYRQASKGKLGLVLGAGNISSIAPMDALYKLFAENQVVLVKMNPVNAYMGPFLEQAFDSLQQDGFFEVAYGGADLGRYLCQHPAIEAIHMTGSHRTHDAIVWGETPGEQAQRKAVHTPVLTKPMTSELGCVTPILVVPGDWSAADLRFQARQVASMVAHNASFNCVAAKVLVTAKGWPQRQAFLEQVHQELARTPRRQAYYSGAHERYDAFLDRYPQAVQQGDGALIADELPWTTISDVPAEAGEYALTEEAFCGVLAEVALEATNAGDFLAQAVPFANEQVWGNLSCVVLIHPRTQRRYRAQLDQAIANLRYGGIGINVWSGIVYLAGVTSWGAYPGNPLENIQSGRGVVHNTYLFDHPQKSVLYAPFRMPLTPIWFADHKNLRELAQHYAALQAQPSWRKLLDVFLAALSG
jgi:acyl-CoA reductase-like NAD-dependent aldehyde dehydrogenase